MSIIHDALKKAQEQSQKPKEDPSTGSIWSAPTPPEPPIERLPHEPKKARSILALICALAFIFAAFFFLYKQINTYFPEFMETMQSAFSKLTHQKEPSATIQQPARPLATITIAPKPVAPAKPITPLANPKAAVSPVPSITVTPPPPPSVTLDIHGVMANGKSNVALINNQVYQEGDEVDGVKIIKITLDSILVDNNGRQEKIPVNQ